MKPGTDARSSGQTRDWYRAYYAAAGQDRNDLLSNPEVLFQHFAIERSVITALRRADLQRGTSRILDVGCGMGFGLGRLLQLGFNPEELYGIDILQERIDAARARYPNVRISSEDATALSFQSDSFNLVLESTMFVQITDEALARSIAGEMLRVTRPGGYLMVTDWRYGKPGHAEYRAVTARRIASLFAVGSESEVVCTTPGALVPPVGRLLSRYLPSAYFVLQRTLPFLVGLKTTLLKKRSA